MESRYPRNCCLFADSCPQKLASEAGFNIGLDLDKRARFCAGMSSLTCKCAAAGCSAHIGSEAAAPELDQQLHQHQHQHQQRQQHQADDASVSSRRMITTATGLDYWISAGQACCSIGSMQRPSVKAVCRIGSVRECVGSSVPITLTTAVLVGSRFLLLEDGGLAVDF